MCLTYKAIKTAKQAFHILDAKVVSLLMTYLTIPCYLHIQYVTEVSTPLTVL